MTTERKSEKTVVPFVPGFWALVALGGLLGYALCLRTGDIFTQRLYYLFGTFCAGFGWAYIFLQVAEMVGEAIALLRDPIPAELDIGNREAVTAHLEKLKGTHHVTQRIRNLLQSWVEHGNARVVMALAGLQGRAAARSVIVGGFFGLIMFVVAAFLYVDPWLTWGGLAVLALVLFTRQTFSMQTDAYLESRLLARLPGNIPHTAMTARELAGELGREIRFAFREAIPDPEKAAEAMKSALASVIADTSAQLQKIQQAFVQTQSQLVDRWMKAAETTTADLKNIQSALSTVIHDLTAGLSKNAEHLNAILKEHAEGIKAGGGDWSQRIGSALADQLAKFESSQQALAAQLEKIASLQQSIEKVLQIQQVVDGTIKTVAASEEFAKLVSALREHLEASDKLLREVSRPRTIRLVETEIETGDVPPNA